MKNFVRESRFSNAEMVAVFQSHLFVTMRQTALMQAMKVTSCVKENQKELLNAI